MSRFTITRCFIVVLALVISACTTPSDSIIQYATALNRVTPKYPMASRLLGEEGSVLLLVYIRVDGGVGEIKVQNSSGSSRLDNSAIDAVRQSTFAPAKTRSGRSVGSWSKTPYIFRLND